MNRPLQYTAFFSQEIFERRTYLSRLKKYDPGAFIEEDERYARVSFWKDINNGIVVSTTTGFLNYYDYRTIFPEYKNAELSGVIRNPETDFLFTANALQVGQHLGWKMSTIDARLKPLERMPMDEKQQALIEMLSGHQSKDDFPWLAVFRNMPDPVSYRDKLEVVAKSSKIPLEIKFN